ncbi:type III restriction/modification enzyme restriction subunit [Marinirhabdus gelatinilytica]|uniref:Type III restriction/modification enzyme restriction subunit n=1 Tax=Marinirhabdus gelatinilytica TaxID=1703343 RepID=A0A370QKK5_9FLAO|nr:type III restriction/modification enzyme restriction subunit [Marinirhabdus gelatinilytica]
MEEFDTHLEDDHLHVVAPPGSGKTVLGLEMVQRLDKKTLILAPTLTIRNQWYERMLECFVKDRNCIETSFSIKKPATLTFSTYQSLHSLFKNDLEYSSEKLLKFFQEAEIGTLVLDEAHHLKNEWWKPLFNLKKLQDCTLIALTATPPYDSEKNELKKYFDLCGPIDMEIGVPELVREGNLCPHQDYIHFSEPDAEQIQYIITYRENLMRFVETLKANKDFIAFIQKHPFYAETEAHLEEIYKNPERFSALLIYLNAAGATIPKTKVEFLGIKAEKVQFPSLSYEWVEALLTPFLIEEREYYEADEALLLHIEKQLRKIGAFDLKRINLTGEKSLYRKLAQSPSKLKSIVEIVKAESQNLQRGLRMVVLSDYIRKEFLEVQHNQSVSEINKLGVVPIFQFVRNAIKNDVDFPLRREKLGVLTGSLIILHNSVIDELSTLISAENFIQEILWETEFVIIKPNVQGSKKMVAAMTQLFETGHIEVLIGTKSLLGEGWDAPAINTLVLASFVGSFVMSNQMRGRAIRVHSLQPSKVANIWHIACVDPTSETGGADLELLYRRFGAFCGISLQGEPYIENGADRLKLLPETKKDVPLLNQKMMALATKRGEVMQRWKKAIGDGDVLVRELKVNYEKPQTHGQLKKLYFKDALRFLILELSAIFTVLLPELFFKNLTTLLAKGVLFFIYALVLGFAMILLPKTVKVVTLYLKYGRRDKELIKIAHALKTAMVAKGMILEAEQKVSIKVDAFEDGSLSCYLLGASAKEGILFVTYLQEIINPIENPRYIIAQSNWVRKKLGFSNYYSVPKVFGERKADAMVFYKAWKRYNGVAQFIFTRNTKGRKLLLKARFHSYQDTEKVTSRGALIWK